MAGRCCGKTVLTFAPLIPPLKYYFQKEKDLLLLLYLNIYVPLFVTCCVVSSLCHCIYLQYYKISKKPLLIFEEVFIGILRDNIFHS